MSRSEALVSTEWLVENADSADIRIIEVDEDTDAYGVSHIPGSIAWHWSDDLHDRPRRELISQDQVAALLAKSGVGPNTTVVLYGGNNNWFAAYGYWTLKYRGFDRVKLLDGGRKKWEAENLPQTTAIPDIAPADPGALGPERPELRDLYGGVGVTSDKQVTAYCRIGERSSHTWFVLHELLEYPNVRNYDGSWTEYGSLVGVPVER